jgi:TPR repeat protein
MKQFFFSAVLKSMMAIFKAMSYIPLLSKAGKELYSSCLFSEADLAYYYKHYQAAARLYSNALNYTLGMENDPAYTDDINRAYERVGSIYEKGIEVEKNPLYAELCYLRAGYRGNTAHLHKVATQSWYETHWR